MSNTDKKDHWEYLERYDPTGRCEHMATEHLARYEWACGFLPARRVLDCACGPGYGSALLKSRGAESVIGFDISEEAVGYANQHYGAPGIEYRAGDALSLDPHQVGRFDLIVSLETIEHLHEPTRLLDVFKNLLEPDGILALSCPNDEAWGDNNPFHFWKERRAQLPGWLRERFAGVDCYFEMHPTGTIICAADQEAPQNLRLRGLDQAGPAMAAGFLFACTPSGAPRRAGNVAVLEQGGYRYVREMAAAREWLEQQRRQYEEALGEQEKLIAKLHEWTENSRKSHEWLENENRELKAKLEELEKSAVKKKRSGWLS